MWIECPVAFKKRIDKEIVRCPSLTLTKETAPQIIQNLKEEYEINNLKRFGKWKNGSLPYMYIIPKDKDPYNKSRLIASYWDHPLKYVYKNTSKIITWCFKQIEKSKHFTLYRITDIMTKTKDAARWLRRNGPNQDIMTVQTDVKQMYTNLSHVCIKDAINWLLHKVLDNGKTRKRNLCYFIMEKSYPNKIYLSRARGDKTAWSFDIADIMSIVNLDLDTAYQTKGQDIYIQKNGCPMGGLLSAIYANVKCAYDEVNFIHRIGMRHNKFFGVRQMDDLILWIAYTKGDNNSHNEALSLKNMILTPNQVYTGGLELEEQDYTRVSSTYTVHKFAGTVIHCHYWDKIHFVVHTLNRNSDSIRDNYQRYPRYINATSNTAPQYKKSVIIGSLFRFFHQSQNEGLLKFTIWENFLEMRICGYNTLHYVTCLVHMTKYDNNNKMWHNILYWFLDEIKTKKEEIDIKRKEMRRIEKRLYPPT